GALKPPSEQPCNGREDAYRGKQCEVGIPPAPRGLYSEPGSAGRWEDSFGRAGGIRQGSSLRSIPCANSARSKGEVRRQKGHQQWYAGARPKNSPDKPCHLNAFPGVTGSRRSPQTRPMEQAAGESERIRSVRFVGSEPSVRMRS